MTSPLSLPQFQQVELDSAWFFFNFFILIEILSFCYKLIVRKLELELQILIVNFSSDYSSRNRNRKILF